MPRRRQADRPSFKHSFARVYDPLYGMDSTFLQAQIAFLTTVFGTPRGALLDIGCGTGLHVAALVRLGYSVVGLDVDPLMLEVAHRKIPEGRLVLADLRQLPFPRSFSGALCLESPLAYALEDEALMAALRSVRDALRQNSRFVIDVYDYVGTFAFGRVAEQEACFEVDALRVTVRESHHYAKRDQIWTMVQKFKVEEAGTVDIFEVVHRLRMRTMDEYASALETAGFTILEAITAYPNAPETPATPNPSWVRETLGYERTAPDRRLILVARRGGSV